LPCGVKKAFVDVQKKMDDLLPQIGKSNPANACLLATMAAVKVVQRFITIFAVSRFFHLFWF
jgi:hypothetical protein